jgi:hypothetical protein
MKTLLDNMWTFVLVLLLVSMGISTAVYLAYMRSHLIS